MHDYKLSFYRSSVDTGRLEEIRFESGEEPGNLIIADPELVAGSSDRWIRYFENGAVILNLEWENEPSSTPADLRQDSGMTTGSPADWVACLDTAASPTGHYCRLDGSRIDFSGAWVNDGTWAPMNSAGKSCFPVPKMDALFIIACRPSELLPVIGSPAIPVDMNPVPAASANAQ
jgi:hypothetical protein